VVVIAGEPNVGKSSLFNALLGQSRAIVTDIPGTTRDAIESFLETEHWPLRLVDTAGLRETIDTIERIGIEVSERYLRSADLVLACGDSEASVETTTRALQGKTNAAILRVHTKSDLLAGAKPQRGDASSASVEVSATTGEGLHTLMAVIDQRLSDSIGTVVADMPILTRTRHIQGIQQAREEISAFEIAWKQQMLPPPVAAVHLRSAAMELESLIGAVSVEDVLDRVFSSFCVGK
jgi:tRNA modification GTPase